jgi:hypothetical protein
MQTTPMLLQGIQKAGGPMLPSSAVAAELQHEHPADYSIHAALQGTAANADPTTPSSRKAASSLLSVKDTFEKHVDDHFTEHVQGRRSLLQAGMELMAHARAGRAQIGEQQMGEGSGTGHGADRSLSSDSSSSDLFHYSSSGEQNAAPRLQLLRGSNSS